MATRFRIAGPLYLGVAITTGYGVVYVPSLVLSDRERSSMAEYILRQEFFGSGILSHLIGVILSLTLALLLYKLLTDVNVHQVRLMVVFALMHIRVDFFIETLHGTIIMIAKGILLTSFDKVQRGDYAISLVRIHQLCSWLDN